MKKDPYALERAEYKKNKGEMTAPMQKFYEMMLGEAKGKDGYTPVFGKDYFTAAQIKDIKEAVVNLIPKPKDGKDADYNLVYEYVVQEVSKAVVKEVAKIPKPKDGEPGKDAVVDMPAIVESLLKAMPKMEAKEADYLGIKDYIDKQVSKIKIAPPLMRNGGTNSLRQLTDVDLSGLSTDAQGNYILGGGSSLPDQTGNSGKFLTTDGAEASWGTPAGAGDVVGPASAVDSNFAAFDGITGKLIKDSTVSTSSFATAAQGALADTSLQPGDKTGIDAEVVSGTAGTSGNLSKWDANGDLIDTIIKEVRVANQLSSGLIDGGQLSINANPALFDISDGNGVIVDNVTNPEVPVIYNVSWTGLTAQTVTNLATQSVTHVYIDNTGAVFQASTAPTPTERRAYIYLGQLGHTNNTSIGAAIPSPDLFVSPVAQVRDLEQSLGVISTGNIVTANGANLSIDKSVGTLFSNGINFFSDDSNPSNKTYAAQTPVSMRLRTQTGNGSTTTTLDVGNYDLAGTITSIGATKAQNFRVYLTTGGNVVVQYGQTLYNNLAAAAAGLQGETSVRFANLGENSILIGIISAMSNATDLSLDTDAKFYTVSKFGEVGGAAAGVSVSTLQNVYNNSTSPEIITNSTLGAVTVKRGSAADTDTVMEVQNAAGTVTQSVTGNGVINSAALTASELTATDASKNIVSLPVATYPSLAETAHVKGVTSAIQTQLDAKLTKATNFKSKAITIESPTATEDLSLFFTDDAITVTQLNAVSVGTTPSVTYTIRHGTDRSATGAEVVTGGSTTTSTTTGDEVTSFNDATIVAGSWVWLETTATSGTVTNVNVTIEYTVD